MGLINFVTNAGEKLFGSSQIDENKVRQHILDQGLSLKRFSVVAHQQEKMVSLIGYADTMADKEKAIVTAGNIDGVEKVDDRLRIGEPAPAAQPKPAPQPAPTGSAPQAASQPPSAQAAATKPAPHQDAAPAVKPEDAPEPDANEAPTAKFYTVMKGDTLSKISKEAYGDANKYNAIFEANKPMLKHPDKIYPGQVLRIPPL